MPHVDTVTALDALEGRLPAEQMGLVGRHVTECSACAAEFDRFGHLLGALTGKALQSAPERVVHRAIDIFSATGEKPASILEVIADLLFDSWATLAVAGLRGHNNSRQLAFAAGDYDVHIGLDGVGAQTSIRGQLLARDDQTFVDTFDVALVDEMDTELVTTGANEFGEFHFDSLPAGGAAIAIRLPNAQTIRCLLPTTLNPAVSKET